MISMRNDNESLDKYHERLKNEKKDMKKVLRGQVIQCKCGKVRTTLRKLATDYRCPTCYPGEEKNDGKGIQV